MQITHTPGYWFITFDSELATPDALLEFIERLSKMLPSGAWTNDGEVEPYQDVHEAERAAVWKLADLWRPEFDRLYDEMFKDKNQISMDF